MIVSGFHLCLVCPALIGYTCARLLAGINSPCHSLLTFCFDVVSVTCDDVEVASLAEFCVLTILSFVLASSQEF